MPSLSPLFRPLTRLGRLLDRPPAADAAARPGAPAVQCAEGPTLQGIGLTRSFGSGDGKTFAIRDVSLELRRSELNLLMGPSGSGKSTLLAVISALLRPDGGAVRALGHDVWRMTERELERFRLRHCSYIFQGYNLFPALTAREQLEVVLKWGEGLSGADARKRADRVLGRLGIAHKAHLRPAQLSGGEKQRVAIGRALVKDPSFLFADEPTSALDWENGHQVIELLREIARERGATVLVVTHDHRLTPYADRVLEMADGRIRGDAATDPDTTVIACGDAPTPLATPSIANHPRLRLTEPAAFGS